MTFYQWYQQTFGTKAPLYIPSAEKKLLMQQYATTMQGASVPPAQQKIQTKKS